MTATVIDYGPQSGWLKVKVEGNTTAVANSLGSILNPEGVLLHVYRGFLITDVDADAAATLDIGIGTTGADSTDICSAYDINGASHHDVINLIGTDLASEGAATTPKGVDWGATEYLNFYNPAAASSENFVGYAYFKYIRVGEDVE